MFQEPKDSAQGKWILTPKSSRSDRSTGKLMLIPFFDTVGFIYIPWDTHGQTVNNKGYVEILRQFERDFIARDQTSSLVSGTCTRTMPPAINLSWWQTTWPIWGSKLSLIFHTVQTYPHATCGYSRNWRRSTGVYTLRIWIRWRKQWQAPWTPIHWRMTKWLERYKCIEVGGSYSEGIK